MLSKKTILLVDDDARNIFALSAALKPKNALLITAQDGNECITRLKAGTKIDLILLDMMMPVKDGYETLKEIRSDSDLKDIPVIAITAQAMKGDHEKCIAAGANDYCSKPVEINQLLSKIQNLLKHG